MPDDFGNHTVTLTSPAVAAELITPDDNTDLQHATRAIYVGTPGTLRLTMVTGDTVTLANLQPGIMHPLRAARVLATGTTATGIIGLR